MFGSVKTGSAVEETPPARGAAPYLAEVSAQASTVSEPLPPAMRTSLSTEGRFAWGNHLFRVVTGTHTLSLVDQAVISATSFITTILVGRWCGADELGVYSMGFSLLISWISVQESLVSLPYTIYRHRFAKEDPAEYAGSALTHYLLLSALAMAVLVVTAVGLFLCGAVSSLVTVTWVLTAVVPFALLREFRRQFAFAHLRMAQALGVDLVMAALQIVGLAWLGWARSALRRRCLRRNRRSLRHHGRGLALFRPPKIHVSEEFSTAVARAQLGNGEMALRQSDHLVIARLHQLLAAGVDARDDRNRRVCRVHDAGTLREPFHARDW